VSELEPFAAALDAIREEVDTALKTFLDSEIQSANESQNEPQHSDSNTNDTFEFEPAFEKARSPVDPQPPRAAQPKTYPVGFVLKACPDIADYAVEGIANWRDLMATAAQVRGYLGISPSAYEDACHVMGQEAAAMVVACILQRAQHITSAGGYLRSLTEKARVGQFTAGPMLMAAYKANVQTSRMAG
jgi:replication initiation protein RepC